MMSARCVLLALLALTGAHAVAADSMPRRLAHDPFVRPAFALPAAPASPASPAAIEAASTELPFKLLMVINAGDRSLVNAGGKILKLREKIEGYQLVAVGDGKATFIKDGVKHEAEIGKETKK